MDMSQSEYVLLIAQRLDVQKGALASKYETDDQQSSTLEICTFTH